MKTPTYYESYGNYILELLNRHKPVDSKDFWSLSSSQIKNLIDLYTKSVDLEDDDITLLTTLYNTYHEYFRTNKKQ